VPDSRQKRHEVGRPTKESCRRFGVHTGGPRLTILRGLLIDHKQLRFYSRLCDSLTRCPLLRLLHFIFLRNPHENSSIFQFFHSFSVALALRRPQG